MTLLQLVKDGLLPVTAIFAVVLFALKEIIEARRRKKASELKLKALKELLAIECQRNKWALDWLRRAANDIKDALKMGYDISIRTTASGTNRLHFERGKRQHGSSPVPTAFDEFMKEYLFEAASLDKHVFAKMSKAIWAVEEIRHLLRGLIEYVRDEARHLGGWAEYAEVEVNKIEAELGKLYFTCCGTSDIPAMVRPFPYQDKD